MSEISRFHPRTLSLLLAVTLLLAACSHVPVQRGAGEGASTNWLYSGGIEPPGNQSAAEKAGIYPATARNECCFLKRRSAIILTPTAGARTAVFHFYVPPVAPLRTGEDVAVQINGRTAGHARLYSGSQELAVPLAASTTPTRAIVTMSKSFVPKQLGMNDDPRELTVLLQSVTYR